jgi:hypothetical protein
MDSLLKTMSMPGARNSMLCALVGGALAGLPLRAQEVVLREGETGPQSGMFAVPFAFQNDTTGPAVGAAIAGRGWPQDTSLAYLSLVQAFNPTTYLYARCTDLELPGTERFFADLKLAVGRYSQINSYSDGNPLFKNETAGHNDSSAENYIEGSGRDNMVRLELEYVAPWGHGADHIKSHVWLRDGILVRGGRDPAFWNPLTTGTTTFHLAPLYRKQEVNSAERGDETQTTAGLECAVKYDNTDFSENPSHGSMQQLRVTRDAGWLDSTASWMTVDFEWAKYFSLGPGGGARQRVVALDFWIIDTPSWNDDVASGATPHHPPPYAGATLGGLDRMRGFPQSRFHDRSAICYAGEYRHTLDWNPLAGNSILKFFHVRVDWIQLVGFAEVGRVADEFDLNELHSDMKTDGGIGLRVLANNLVVRADYAVSSEGSLVQMIVNHPF